MKILLSIILSCLILVCCDVYEPQNLEQEINNKDSIGSIIIIEPIESDNVINTIIYI